MDKKDLNAAFDSLTPPPELETSVKESVTTPRAIIGGNARRGASSASGTRVAAAAHMRRKALAIALSFAVIVFVVVPLVAWFGFNSTGYEGGLRSFSSISEVKNYVQLNARKSSSDNWIPNIFEFNSKISYDTAEVYAPASPEHSTTNVQVEGVAESDIVHTDGNYIYTLSYYNLSIVDIRGGAFEQVIELEYDNFAPSEMYLLEDSGTLVVLGNTYTDSPYSEYAFEKVEVDPGVFLYWQANTLSAKIYSVSELLGGKTEPNRELTFSNCHLSASRMIGSKLYLVMNTYAYYHPSTTEQWLPGYNDSLCGDVELGAEDFYATPDNGRTYNFTVFAGLDVEANENAEVTAYFGSTGTLYASPTAFYITYGRFQKTTFFGYYKFEYLGLGVMRLAISGTSLEYKGFAKVNGSANSQFNMDEYTYSGGEYDGQTYFRIATTDTMGRQNESFITVFNSDMVEVGKVGGIGVGERIYSVRYNGEQAVVVTYLQIDPFYVIDLSNPYAPTIKGELKIPGVSDYLHFLKVVDGQVFAVGRSGTDGRLGGMKVSIFDITGEIPDEVYYHEANGTGSSSEATYNHKAIMYFMPDSGDKEIFALPVTENFYSQGYSYYTHNLYYYEIDSSGEVTAHVLGYHVTQHSGAPNSSYHNRYRDQLLRSVIAGDYLYLIGNSGIERFPRNNLPDSPQTQGEIITYQSQYWTATAPQR